ncbi:MAG: hypothetical protein PHD37_17355 [Gallionellaceae bacterium]|nr:hypothetical protein [Gallionellaceae bacterium]
MDSLEIYLIRASTVSIHGPKMQATGLILTSRIEMATVHGGDGDGARDTVDFAGGKKENQMMKAKRYWATVTQCGFDDTRPGEAGVALSMDMVLASDADRLEAAISRKDEALRRCVGTLVHLRHGTNSIITRTLDLDDSPLSLRDGLKADLADMRESMKRIDDDLAAARAVLEEKYVDPMDGTRRCDEEGNRL